MFGQLLPNTNEMLQRTTVLYSDSAGAKSAELNKALAPLLGAAY
jgi:hypothetical protein